MNPYWGVSFFEFFSILFQRLSHWDFQTLATDELQIGVFSCISISCGLIGPFLVLKKMAMFANALSHTLLLGVVGAFLIFGGSVFSDFSHLFVGALIAAILTAIFTEGLIKWFRLSKDASIGLIFTFFFALGIVLVTVYMRDMHLGIESVMGNADALQRQDLRLALNLMCINVGAILFFYRHFQITSFDPFLAKTLRIPVSSFHFLLLFLVAITCIGAFRAVGVLLVLALLIGPYLTARFFCHNLLWLIVHSCWIGILASLTTVALTRHILSVYDLAISTGGTLVCVIGAFYFLALALKEYVLPRLTKYANLPEKIMKQAHD